MIAPTLPICVQDCEFNLLDGSSVKEMLHRALPTLGGLNGIEDVRVERCWPVGNNAPSGFVLEWSFRAKRRRHAVYGECGARRKIRRRPAGSRDEMGGRNHTPRRPIITADGLRGLALEVEGTDLVLRSPDQDELLPQMSVCLSGKRMAPRLRAFGLRPESNGGSLRCRLGGYRPGRRATVRFRNGESSTHLCGKTFRDDRGQKVIERHLRVSEQLRRGCGGRVRVPAPVGFDHELNMALFVWMPGVQAETLGRGGDDLLRAAVEVLSQVHELPGTDNVRFGPEDEYAVVDRWRKCIGRLMPGAALEADELADRLQAASTRACFKEGTTIHRDFYEKQIIIAPQCITLLDLDTLACGDVCVDLGNFLAHLLLRELSARGSSESFTVLADRFLAGYEAQRGRIDRANLSFYTATSLFRLGAVHALRTLTTPYRRVLWDTAMQVLACGEFDTKALADSLTGDLAGQLIRK
jgi:hypothetical protein